MGESVVKKRFITSLAAGGLMAAMVPGVAAAQTEGEGTTTYTTNVTCEAGQESPLALPPCEFDEEAGLVTFAMLNPASTTGALEGVQVFDAVGVQNVADGSFSGSGLLFWSGTVEGCGAGTFYAEGEFAGAPDADGVNTFSVNDFTIVPGGSLPITGTIDGTGTEVPNDDGSATQATTSTYSCDEAPAAEGDADAEDVADDAEAQAEDKADDSEDKADAKEDELEDKADAKEDELEDKTDK
jgi:hypothetical protein